MSPKTDLNCWSHVKSNCTIDHCPLGEKGLARWSFFCLWSVCFIKHQAVLEWCVSAATTELTGKDNSVYSIKLSRNANYFQYYFTLYYLGANNHTGYVGGRELGYNWIILPLGGRGIFCLPKTGLFERKLVNARRLQYQTMLISNIHPWLVSLTCCSVNTTC